MIKALPVFIKYDNMELLKNIDNISYAEEADITINFPKPYKYNIEYHSKANRIFITEIWVETLEEKIEIEKEEKEIPVIILTKNKELLPYCMKDRLTYLQDKINKEKGRY